MATEAFTKYASVILDLSIGKALDYGIAAHMENQVQRGMRVEVPIRGKSASGYILEFKEAPDYSPVKGISKTTETIIPEDLFTLALWVSKYYCTPLQQVLQTIVPSSIRTDTKPKQQLFVMRAKTREELQEYCIKIRNSHSAQAAVLDVMLKTAKGILLSELLEQTKGSRSPIDTLAKKGLLSVDIVRVDRSPLQNEQYFQTKQKELNSEQAQALKKISDSLEDCRFETHLLHGVTGSGKTEVYLQAIDKALQQNKGTIMLVPEIALTSQTIERFRRRFEGHIAILHHRLSHGERCDEWHKIQQGNAQIVIGARSAIFSPVKNLGLIIVDEEHENSYKQTDGMPCYHARDVAVVRGKQSNATVILGSATPSLESYYNALIGKYTLSKLNARADSASLPQVSIIDMKKEFEKAKGYTTFSNCLLEGIKKRIALGEQSILFLNRRGYHTTLQCQQCAQAVRCRHCDISLTYHRGEHVLACHLCGYTLSPPPKECPACQSPNPMKFRGIGTEQVEKALHAILPDVRTLRIDADTTRHKGSHQKLLRAFGTGKADVLIGTQMIAKGLHFPSVTLVGVLNSDNSLNIPDFRASETVFQLITQVAGRSGRGAMQGEVIIQTCLPENTTIQQASKQDYEAFYSTEIASREMFHYPPYTQMVKLMLSGLSAETTQKQGELLRQHLIQTLDPKVFEVNPVIPAGYAKIKDKFRYHFFVRGPRTLPINRALEAFFQNSKSIKGVKITVDVNPTSTFF